MRTAAVVLTIGAVVALGACAGQPARAPASSASWVEPQWMTESRAFEEEGAAEMEACLAASGLGLTRNEDGTVSGTVPSGLDEAEQRALMEKTREAGDSCAEQAYGPGDPEQPFHRIPESYQRLFDTKACVEAHGYTVGEPPSEDRWAEEAASSSGPLPWTPFGDLQLQIEAGTLRMTHDEYVDLYRACPQDGIVITGLA